MTNPPPPGYGAATPLPASPVNRAGRIALIFAIVSVAVGLVQQLVSVFLPSIMVRAGVDFSVITVIFSVLTVIRTLISAGALAFGWYGATRRGLPQLTSGIGLGIGASGVISGIVGLIAVPIAGFVL